MKTRLTIILLLIASLAIGQFTELKYVGKGFNRHETFDWQYGRYNDNGTIQGAGSPSMLCIIQDGEYVTGRDALDLLQEPTWGINSDQAFVDIMPDYTPPVKTTIPSQVCPWFMVLDTMPTEEWLLGYELRALDGRIYQHVMLEWIPLIVENYETYEIIDWRQMGDGLHSYFDIPNPMYEQVEAERAAQRAIYVELLDNTFTQMVTYTFPSFRSNKACTWSLKMEGQPWTVIPNDKDYWLASPTGGWIKVLKEPRETELREWSSYCNIMNLDKLRQLKMLLGIRN